MKWMVLTLGLCCASFAASAEWRNEDLERRGVSRAQSEAIGKGDLAQCLTEGRSAVAGTAPQRQCNEFMSAFEFQQCRRANETASRSSQQAGRDIVIGCMARKGWLQY